MANIQVHAPQLDQVLLPQISLRLSSVVTITLRPFQYFLWHSKMSKCY